MHGEQRLELHFARAGEAAGRSGDTRPSYAEKVPVLDIKTQNHRSDALNGWLHCWNAQANQIVDTRGLIAPQPHDNTLYSPGQRNFVCQQASGCPGRRSGL